MPRLAVIGSLNRDTILRVPHQPQPGETVAASGRSEVSGGKGANQAVAAARLGADTLLIGCVGDDPAGEAILTDLAEVDRLTLAVDRLSDTPTGSALITVSDDGENSIVVHAGANAAVDAACVARHRSVTDADFTLMQLETPVEAIAAAADAGARLVLDPAPAIPIAEALLRRVSILSPNQSEAAVLVGGAEAEVQAAELHRRYGCHVAMKRGAEGAFWLDQNGPVASPALPVEVVDTTAAGDTFTAALAVALAEGHSPQDALWFACVAGSLATTRAGAIPSIPTRAEVDARL